MTEGLGATSEAIALENASTPFALHGVHGPEAARPEVRTDPTPQLQGLPVGTSRAKRVLDLLCVAATAPLTVPLVGLAALLVTLDSPGPVLYKQRRIGRGGVPFEMYKFRSMVVNGDAVLDRHLEGNPAAQREWAESRKLRKDPRITRVGRWLRRTSLDELPQLFNVLRGDMSIVGPRPIIQREVDFYRGFFGFYLEARPGLTGVWQVSGRNDVSYDDRVRMDVRYVLGWSLIDDLSILARTARAVISGRGAY